ncbi:hypothetical protein PINS_up013987 [Pythium insidiosum]|nr:hypothetical protein PINS_up013987 [Pythium insidiosum]
MDESVTRKKTKNRTKAKTSLWAKIKNKAKAKSKQKLLAQPEATANATKSTIDENTGSIASSAKTNINTKAGMDAMPILKANATSATTSVEDKMAEVEIPIESHIQDARDSTLTAHGCALESPIKDIVMEVAQEPKFQRVSSSKLHPEQELQKARDARRLAEERFHATAADLEALRWQIFLKVQPRNHIQAQAQDQAQACNHVSHMCVDADSAAIRRLSEESNATTADTTRLSDDDEDDSASNSVLESELDTQSRSTLVVVRVDCEATRCYASLTCTQEVCDMLA